MYACIICVLKSPAVTVILHVMLHLLYHINCRVIFKKDSGIPVLGKEGMGKVVIMR